MEEEKRICMVVVEGNDHFGRLKESMAHRLFSNGLLSSSSSGVILEEGIVIAHGSLVLPFIHEDNFLASLSFSLLSNQLPYLFGKEKGEREKERRRKGEEEEGEENDFVKIEADLLGLVQIDSLSSSLSLLSAIGFEVGWPLGEGEREREGKRERKGEEKSVPSWKQRKSGRESEERERKRERDSFDLFAVLTVSSPTKRKFYFQREKEKNGEEEMKREEEEEKELIELEKDLEREKEKIDQSERREEKEKEREVKLIASPFGCVSPSLLYNSVSVGNALLSPFSTIFSPSLPLFIHNMRFLPGCEGGALFDKKGVLIALSTLPIHPTSTLSLPLSLSNSSLPLSPFPPSLPPSLSFSLKKEGYLGCGAPIHVIRESINNFLSHLSSLSSPPLSLPPSLPLPILSHSLLASPLSPPSPPSPPSPFSPSRRCLGSSDIVEVRVGNQWSSGAIVTPLQSPQSSLLFSSSSSSFPQTGIFLYVMTVSHVFHSSLLQALAKPIDERERERRKGSVVVKGKDIMKLGEKSSLREYLSLDLVSAFHRSGFSVEIRFSPQLRKGNESERRERKIGVQGEVVFISPSHLDVALIRIPLPSSISLDSSLLLTPINRSTNICPGDPIMIFGLGKERRGPSSSSLAPRNGVISKIIKRKGKVVLFQTDAEIVEGDSGGIVLDNCGNFVGMVFCNFSNWKRKEVERVNFCVGCESLEGLFTFIEKGGKEFSLLGEMEVFDDVVDGWLWRCSFERGRRISEIGVRFREFVAKL